MQHRNSAVQRIPRNNLIKNVLGEKLSKEEAKGLMNELCDPEDDEGFTPFMRKLKYILH